MLLHVFAPPAGIDAAANGHTSHGQLALDIEIMQHAAIFCVGDLGHAQPAQPFKSEPSCVMNLPAAGWVKRRFAQHDSRPILLWRDREHLFDDRIEFMHLGIVVIETLGHDGSNQLRKTGSTDAGTATKKVRHRRPTAHERARYRCFLPDLAGLAGKRRAEPMPDSTY